MPITTGAYPAALGPGRHTMNETAADKSEDETIYGAPQKGAGSGQAEGPVLAAAEKGYSQRKAMAAGMIKAT